MLYGLYRGQVATPIIIYKSNEKISAKTQISDPSFSDYYSQGKSVPAPFLQGKLPLAFLFTEFESVHFF